MSAEVFGGPPAVTRKKKSASIAVGSLNSGVRLEENKRIYQENLMLFNKFKDTKSDIRKVDLDDRYTISRKYLKFASREPQLKFVAKMNLENPTPLSLSRRSPSVTQLHKNSSKTKLPQINMHKPRGSFAIGTPSKSLKKSTSS